MPFGPGRSSSEAMLKAEWCGPHAMSLVVVVVVVAVVVVVVVVVVVAAVVFVRTLSVVSAGGP